MYKTNGSTISICRLAWKRRICCSSLKRITKLFIPQDHVVATFGAGLGSACVVDIGHEKTSVSCVEDGVSHAETRIHMDCGGSDTSGIFFELLRDIGFPYKDCNPADNHLDVRLC